MTLSLPEVQPVALNLPPQPEVRSTDAVVVSNDYGTPNLLFLYYVPFLPDDRKLDLDAIQDEFQTWNAWELGQAETQLIKHVEAGNLPSDDSIASRVARNNYRSKAIEFFRVGSQAWLSLEKNNTGQKVAETTQDEANGVILQQMRALATENQLYEQFVVLINAATGNINLEKENKLFFTHVYYEYDANSKRFLPVVLDTTFTIKKQALETKGSGDGFKIETSLSTNTYNFDRKFWRDNRHEGQEAIDMGEPIRRDMAMDFYVNN